MGRERLWENNTWAIKASALLTFPTSLLIKYKDNPPSLNSGQTNQPGRKWTVTKSFPTTRPSLEPLLGIWTSAKTFKLGWL